MIETLQPVSMGYNTRDAFQELSDVLDDVFGAVINLALIQTNLNNIIASAFAASAVFPPHGAAAAAIGSINSVGLPTQVLSPMYHARANKTINFDFNYLYPFGYKYICSRSVKTT